MPNPNQLATAILGSPPGRKPWRGGPSVTGCTRAVNPAMATWRPDWGNRSIWELTLHMAYWKYRVRNNIARDRNEKFDRPMTDWPEHTAELTDAQWKQDRALLAAEHRKLHAAIENLSAKAILDRATSTYAPIELAAAIATHDAYHIAQIQLLKRAYQAAHPTKPRR